MKKKLCILPCCAAFGVVGSGTPLIAQVPDTLRHTVPAPPVGYQDGAGLGTSVATNGDLVAAGAPNDDIGENSGLVKVFNATTGAVVFVIPNPEPAEYDVFGVSVAMSGHRLVVGAPNDDAHGSDTGSVYVFDLDSANPTMPVVTMRNPIPGVRDSFGGTVAISDARVVVGAGWADTISEDSGRVYVYDLSGGTPAVPVVTLDNPRPGYERGNFGRVVAISGELVVAGASQDETLVHAGSAYVFNVSGPTPTVPLVTLINPSPAPNATFAAAVGIAGTRVLVGAGSARRVYVYDVDSSTPTVPTASLFSPGAGVDDLFGLSLAASAGRMVVLAAAPPPTQYYAVGHAYVYDLGNPVPTLSTTLPGTRFSRGYREPSPSVAISGTHVVLGNSYDSAMGAGAGAAYVYDVAGGTPTVPVILRHPSPALSDYFGTSLAISGTRMVVGAPTIALDWPFTARMAGSAYVFDLGSTTPSVPVAVLNNPTPVYADQFGYSVAVSGTTVAVGAYKDNTRVYEGGSVYVYDLRSNTTATPTAVLINSQPGDRLFGASVSISGTRMVVGSQLYGGNLQGAAYLYELGGNTPLMLAMLASSDSFSSFGYSVAISGPRTVVGAPRKRTNGIFSPGAVYVYGVGNAPAAGAATLNNPTPADMDYFGSSVAVSGERVVVGAHLDDASATDGGIAYVYDLGSATPTDPIVTFEDPEPGAGKRFGISVAISGSRVVVGSYLDGTGAPGAGSVYVYDLDSPQPAVPVATLRNPTPGVNDYFGRSVAIDGTTVGVGAPRDDTTAPDKGAVYIYGPDPPPSDGDRDGLPDSWELGYWTTTSGHGPMDDFDRDGQVELIELAFGLDPTQPDAGALPAVTSEDGFLTMTITKRPGVTYEIESAGTVREGQPDSFSAATTSTIINDGTTLKARDNVRIGTPPARFLRVRVTASP